MKKICDAGNDIRIMQIDDLYHIWDACGLFPVKECALTWKEAKRIAINVMDATMSADIKEADVRWVHG